MSLLTTSCPRSSGATMPTPRIGCCRARTTCRCSPTGRCSRCPARRVPPRTSVGLRRRRRATSSRSSARLRRPRLRRCARNVPRGARTPHIDVRQHQRAVVDRGSGAAHLGAEGRGDEPERDFDGLAAAAEERDRLTAAAREQLAGFPERFAASSNSCSTRRDRERFSRRTTTTGSIHRSSTRCRVVLELGRRLEANGAVDSATMSSTSGSRSSTTSRRTEGRPSPSARTRSPRSAGSPHLTSWVLPPGPPPEDPVSRAVIKMFGGLRAGRPRSISSTECRGRRALPAVPSASSARSPTGRASSTARCSSRRRPLHRGRRSSPGPRRSSPTREGSSATARSSRGVLDPCGRRDPTRDRCFARRTARRSRRHERQRPDRRSVIRRAGVSARCWSPLRRRPTRASQLDDRGRVAGHRRRLRLVDRNGRLARHLLPARARRRAAGRREAR